MQKSYNVLFCILNFILHFICSNTAALHHSKMEEIDWQEVNAFPAKLALSLLRLLTIALCLLNTQLSVTVFSAA